MNVFKMMQKAQKARSQLKKTQKVLASKSIKAEYGGVTIIINGKQEIVSIKLDDTFMKFDKINMEKVLLRALKEANKKIQKLLEGESKSITQNMDISEMMKMMK